MWRADSFENTLMLGKIEGGRRRGWQRIRWLDGITDSMNMSLGSCWCQGGLVCCGSWGHKESDTTEELNWTELMPGQSTWQDKAVLRQNPRHLYHLSGLLQQHLTDWFLFDFVLLHCCSASIYFPIWTCHFLSNTLSWLPLSYRVRINPTVLNKRLFMNFP